MKDIVKLVNGSELQKQLEPLYELKSDIANLKLARRLQLSSTQFPKYAKFCMYQEARFIE